MRRKLTLLAAFAGAGLSALPLMGCLACNDIGCAGGFEWEARAADGGSLTPGSYTFVAELEGNIFEWSCEIADRIGDSDCGEPQLVSGENPYAMNLGLSQLDQVDWNPDSPVAGFYFYAVDVSESDDAGLYSANRGPTDLRLQLARAGDVIFDFDYTPEWTRDDDYRGDSRCGFCDSTDSVSESFDVGG